MKAYLPLATRPASQVGPKLQRQISGGDETILVAEDHDAVRQVLVSLLENRGYVVLQASNGEEALEHAKGHPEVALAILDVVMPGLSGLETYERLRLMRPDLPVILTSGYTGELSSDRFAEDPIAHFVPKPYPPDVVLERVRSALDAALTAAG